MLSSDAIREAAKRAAAAANAPVRVIVFGSYGRGDATEDSDLDLLVVEREVVDRGTEYLRIHEAVGRLGVGVDVLVYSEHEFERRSEVPGTLPYWAKKEGKVIYDRRA
jgi:predicted nucleotidyltransferase